PRPTPRPHRARTTPESASRRGISGSREQPYGARDLTGARFRPEADVGLQVAHHLAKIGQGERLGAIAHGLFGTGMHLYDNAVRADRHARARHRSHQAALARSVARI